MDQSKRKFLSKLPLLGLVAVPGLAVGAVAMTESKNASKVLEDIKMTKDGVTFSHCNFEMKGGIHLTGSNYVIRDSHFNMTGNQEGSMIQLSK